MRYRKFLGFYYLAIAASGIWKILKYYEPEFLPNTTKGHAITYTNMMNNRAARAARAAHALVRFFDVVYQITT